MTENPKTKKRRVVKILLAIFIPLLFCGLVAGGVYAASYYYEGEAVPGSMIGDTSLTGMTPEEIETTAQTLFDSTEISLKIDIGADASPLELTVLPTDINMKLNAAATAQNVMAAGKDTFILLRYIPMFHNNTRLELTYSPPDILAFLSSAFPEVFIDPENPEITYDDEAENFTVTLGKPGLSLSGEELNRIALETAENPGKIIIEVAAESTPPPITDEAAQAAADKANAMLDNAEFTFSVKDGESAAASRDDIASILTFTPDYSSVLSSTDVSSIQMEIGVSKENAVAYVEGALTDELGTKPMNTSAIQDGNGRTLLETGTGKDGTKVADAEGIASQITGALETGSHLTLEVSLDKIAYVAEPVLPKDGEHWAEVNLSTQSAYFYEGNTLLRTCIISSGTAAHRTRVGSFKVWLKVRKQDMSGGSKDDGTYYYTPNVEWISYFDSGIAFHYAYWHNNFGHPMSHGCINMKEDDAIFSYEYMQKDDRVIVHY